MANIVLRSIVNASAEEVWKIVRDFQNVAGYISFIRSSTLEGQGVGACRRLVFSDGTTATEKLESMDEQNKTFSYSLVESPFPMSSYLASMRVSQLGPNTCRLEWTSQFTPLDDAPEDQVRELIYRVYQMGFEGINNLLGKK